MRLLKTLVIVAFLLMISLAALADEVPSLGVDFTPGKPTVRASYISDTEYKDPTLHVVIETGRKDNCDYWLARVKIGHPSQLRTAAAGGFENEFSMNGVYLAKRQNAVLAIDGDYYAYYRYGFILRQGHVYLDKLRAERDVLAIDENGDIPEDTNVVCHMSRTPEVLEKLKKAAKHAQNLGLKVKIVPSSL